MVIDYHIILRLSIDFFIINSYIFILLIIIMKILEDIFLLFVILDKKITERVTINFSRSVVVVIKF